MKNVVQLLFRMMLLTSIWLMAVFTAQAQEPSFCQTTPSENAIGIIPDGDGEFNTSGPYFLKIYIHIIRKNDGTGGQTLQDVEQAINFLNESYNAEHNIYFVRDCDIDYIDNNNHYDNVTCGYNQIFNVNPHDDGIDIYLFDDNNGTNCGLAADIPATAFYVTGTYWNDPAIPFVKSHVLSHEMGHCLGLWHTHTLYSCAELVNGSNCISCGDFVCDTNADPHLGFNVDHPDCEWNSSGTDANGDAYNPDEHNIMAYTNPSCMEYITPGQGDRIRQMIAFSPILQACLVGEPDFFGDNIISTNTTWTANNTPNNGNITIENNLVITCNATLTIEEGVTVKFKTENKLIVTQGASLVLYGTLTSENTSWKGVEVWGNATESQYTIGGIRAQGSFRGKKGGLVENAETAVKLYGPDYSNSGGQIACSGTIFRNNNRAVEFAPYENFWPYPTSQQGQPRSYFGRFSSCIFENNGTGFDAFLHMTGVNGIRIKGCNFINTQASSGGAVADYGYGIFATDAGFIVQAKCTGNTYPCNTYEPNSFSGLGYAIHTSTAATNRPFIVKQTDFSNCYIGIKSNATSGGTIMFNDFNLGNVPDASVNNGEQLGVFFETGINGFSLEQNDFTGEAGNVETTIGVHCKNIGNFNNVIRRNTYTGLTYGNVAEGQNAISPLTGLDRGLLYLCNVNTDISQADFGVAIDPNTNANRIRHSQGVEGEDDDGNIIYIATGNQFSYGTGLDFINQGDAIDYYYYGQGANQEPLTTSGDITNIAQSDANACPNDYCEPPCKTEAEIILEKEKYYQNKSVEALRRSQWQQFSDVGNSILAKQSKNEASYHRLQMDKSAYEIVQYLLYDTINFNADTLAVWLDNLDVVGEDLSKALKAQSEGNHALADSYLTKAGERDNLSLQQQSDLSDATVLLSVLDGKSLYALGKSDLQQLEQLSNQDLGWTGSMARNILGLYGYHFAPSYNLPKEDEKNKVLSSDNKPLVKSEVTVYPNPNTGVFSFAWQPKDTNLAKATLSIRDISGRVIYMQDISPFESNKIEFKDSPQGVYFYQLRIEGAAPQEGKLIIQ